MMLMLYVNRYNIRCWSESDQTFVWKRVVSYEDCVHDRRSGEDLQS